MTADEFARLFRTRESPHFPALFAWVITHWNERVTPDYTAQMRPRDAEAQRQYLPTQAEAQPGPAYDDEYVLRSWPPDEHFYVAGNQGKRPRHPVPRGSQLFPLAHPEYDVPNTEFYQMRCQICTLRRVGRYNRTFHAQVVPAFL